MHYMCVLVVLRANQSDWGSGGQLAGNGWDRHWAAHSHLLAGPLPKHCHLHPMCLANMTAFEGMCFATEAMLSRLLNIHMLALRRALENMERWKEFGRGAEKRWGRCLWSELGHETGQA